MINFGARIMLNVWLSFSMSIILAYVAGAVTAYLLTRAFVFTDSQQSVSHSIGFFILINLVAVLQTWIVSMALADYVLPAMHVDAFRKEIAHGVGIVRREDRRSGS